jgi:hypothetical protein
MLYLVSWLAKRPFFDALGPCQRNTEFGVNALAYGVLSPVWKVISVTQSRANLHGTRGEGIDILVS